MFNTLLKILQHQIIKVDVRESVVLSAVTLFLLLSPDSRSSTQEKTREGKCLIAVRAGSHKRKYKRKRKQTRVNYHNASASANARNGKFFNSLRLRLHFTRVNWGNAKEIKNTRSIPLWFTFKPRWRPPLPSLILFVSQLLV